MKTISFLMVLSSMIALNAFAETYTYVGTLVNDGGNIGVLSQQGFVALDASAFTAKQADEVQACLGKEVKAKVEDRGMVSDLISLSCE